eukprot:8871113-Alexandrium_andersonii.AAC.1
MPRASPSTWRRAQPCASWRGPQQPGERQATQPRWYMQRGGEQLIKAASRATSATRAPELMVRQVRARRSHRAPRS